MEKYMNKTAKLLLASTILLIPAIILLSGEKQEPFSSFVDSEGNITMPSGFRTTYVHLGTWALTSQAAAGLDLGQTAPGIGFHEVYAQPESVKAYKKTGTWPDGTMLIMEVSAIRWDDLPTGHVMSADEQAEWFVMVKDGRGRFSNNPNWGDGWGWALFKAGDPKKNVSTGYKKNCLGCHEVARDTDLVFIQGYPTLR
jgi:hypothetical protein